MGEAVAVLASLLCHPADLKAAIAPMAQEHLSLQGARLVESAEPPPGPGPGYALAPDCWLAGDSVTPGSEALVEAYATVAGTLLRQGRTCELTRTEYASVLARLDQLKRDLDTAHRSEWVATERLRIAQDLHDRVAQTLFGLGLTADWLLTHVDPGEPLHADLDRLKQMASTGMSQVREAIFSLSSAPVEPSGFRTAIRTLLKDLDAAGITGDLKIWGDTSVLPPELTDGLYQIVREALINVRRHSGASSVMVSIRVQPDSVTAVVQDDGRGLPPDVVDTYRRNGAHMGLRGMESRAQRLGGRLSLAPGDEVGLIVSATIPLRGAAE